MWRIFIRFNWLRRKRLLQASTTFNWGGKNLAYSYAMYFIAACARLTWARCFFSRRPEENLLCQHPAKDGRSNAHLLQRGHDGLLVCRYQIGVHGQAEHLLRHCVAHGQSSGGVGHGGLLVQRNGVMHHGRYASVF